MDLWQVKKGDRMRIPRQINVEDRTWLSEGGVIDRDAPYMRELTEGQLYKLEKAPAGAKPDPLPRTILYYVKQRDDHVARQPKRTEVAANAAAERARDTGLASGIQKPDARPAKPKSKADEAIPAGFAD